MPAKTTKYPFRGEFLPLKQIAAMTGIYHRTLLYRHRKGESMESAAERPVLTRQQCGRNAAAAYRSRNEHHNAMRQEPA